jgi:hypothetical protein
MDEDLAGEDIFLLEDRPASAACIVSIATPFPRELDARLSVSL